MSILAERMGEKNDRIKENLRAMDDVEFLGRKGNTYLWRLKSPTEI